MLSLSTSLGFMMIKVFSIFGLLCAFVSGNAINQTAEEPSLCDDHMYCVDKYNCIDGYISTSSIVFPNEYCPSQKICCSIRPRPERTRPKTTLPPMKEICTDTGKFCVLEKSCVGGKIDKSAGGLIEMFSKFEANVQSLERCNATHVCCQLVEEEHIVEEEQIAPLHTREDCTGPSKYCVPKETCISGYIDTTAGPLLNKFSQRNPINKCEENEACCQYGVQDVKGQAKYGEFPWVVQILEKIYNTVSYDYSYLCVGSLVAPNVVLTVVHKIVELNATDLLVRAGEWDTRIRSEPEPHVERHLNTIIIHDNYDDKSMHFDIAILILERDFVLGPLINTISLPSAVMNFDNSRCIVAGWGKKQRADTDYSPILKKIDASIVDRETCQNQLKIFLHHPFLELHSNFICAVGDVQNPCKGDIGAPLMCPVVGSPNRYELAGFLSSIFKCNTLNAPDLYINVSMLQSWISEKTNIF